MEPRVWHQQYDPGVKPSLVYPQEPVDCCLRNTARQQPHKTALIFGGLAPFLGEQHHTLSYQLLDTLVDRFAAGLQQLGLQKGDRVSLYMPNCPQYVIAYYGVLRAGGVVVPSNPLYVPREIEHQLNDSGARFCVALSMLYHHVRQIRHETPLEHVIVTNIKEYFPGLLKLLFTLAKEKKDGHRVDLADDAGTSWFQDFIYRAPVTPHQVEISSDDLAILMYTGGTTGVPKGAELTQRNLMANLIQSAEWLSGAGRLGQDEVMMTALPLIHAYSMTICMNLSVYKGFTQVLIPNPREFQHLLSAINIHRPTILPGVPSLYNAINKHPDVISGKYDIHSINLCLSGAAGLPAEVQEEFQRLTGGRLVEGYGLSECSPVAVGNPLGQGGRIGHIGLPVSDTDCKIVDLDTGTRTLGPNEIGELCIHGPQVMRGYWGKPEEAESVLRRHADGKIWLHTGDVAQMSEDGYFRIVDRQKDVILASGGLNVYPRDIEERLYEHPKVMEAAALGVPVGGDNQRVKVFVVLCEGETATEEEMITWCRDGLAAYKVPKYVEFRDSLPKTMVGKVLRRQLAAEEAEKVAQA